MRSSLLVFTVLALAGCKRPEPVQAPARPAPAMPGPASEASSMAVQHAAASQSPSEVPVKPVAKAQGPGAKTIAQVWAERQALKGKPVVVQGQVVKYNPGILGRNWIHLRDGTGSQAAHDNDLTVTTADSVELGQVVSVKGTVSLDRDIGSGYVYPVLVEEAKVSPAKP